MPSAATGRDHGPHRPGPVRRSATWVGRAVVAAVAIALVVVIAQHYLDAQARNPFTRHEMFVHPHSQAAQAAESHAGHEAELFARLAAIPTAIWLTPEAHPTGSVGPFVGEITDQAEAAEQMPVFVTYAIPARDCSAGHSAGGLDAHGYGAWIEEVAGALRSPAVIIVEPDALAMAAECDRVRERVELISAAVDVFGDAGAVVYIDAGHSDWIDPAPMAELLERAGVNDARGFATNVSAYQSDDAERAYAETLRDLVGGANYVIDSGRNGAGGTPQWCNPSEQALGQRPGAIDDDGLDALVWVKPPGESDGTCGGGPPAGQWWGTRAVELATNAGW